MNKASKAVEPIRALALDILLRFEQGGSHRLKADKLIEERLAAKNSDTNRRFLYALVLGTLRRQARLDAWITRLSGRPLKRLEPMVCVLLRLGLFQLSEMRQVPAYAAIDTTVTLARQRMRSVRTVKFVNAILRQAQRLLDSEDPASFPVSGFLPENAAESGNNLPQRLLWEAAWPEEWSRALLRYYTSEETLAMAHASQTPPPLSIRINTLKITPDVFRQALNANGIDTHPLPGGPPEALLLPAWSGSVRELPGYCDGWFYVQDSTSMWVSRLVDPQPGESILDLCAAPGSKTSHMAALANNQALITALEPASERIALLRENSERLGLQNITIIQTDALAFNASQDALYDKVLVDAPCSGSGTLRRHPEILRHLAPPRLETFISQQLALTEKGLSCLKPQGMLIYSTCSILPPENRELIRTVLQRHPEYSLIFEEQRLTTETADGFYAAILAVSQAARHLSSSQSSWLEPV